MHVFTEALLFYMRKEQTRFHKLVCQEAACFSLGQDQAFVYRWDTCLMDRAMSKWRNKIYSAIGNLHLKVFQEPKTKLQVLYLVSWYCLSILL